MLAHRRACSPVSARKPAAWSARTAAVPVRRKLSPRMPEPATPIEPDRSRFILPGVALVTLAATALWAFSVLAASDRMPSVELRAGTVVTSRIAAAEHKHPRAKAIDDKSVHLWILALPADKQKEVYDTMTASGAKVLHSLPGDAHAWLIQAPTDVVQKLLDKHEFVSVAPFSPSHKFPSGFLAHLEASKENEPEKKVALVAVTAGVADDAMEALAQEVQAELVKEIQGLAAKTWAAGNYINVQVPGKDAVAVAKALANREDVTWVEATSQIQLHNA